MIFPKDDSHVENVPIYILNFFHLFSFKFGVYIVGKGYIAIFLEIEGFIGRSWGGKTE